MKEMTPDEMAKMIVSNLIAKAWNETESEWRRQDKFDRGRRNDNNNNKV